VVAARHRERLLARITRAQAALDLLDGDCPHDDIMTCPHFQVLLSDRLLSTGATGPWPGLRSAPQG
jgi:MerR family transcriptional regulator, copper efflux regulator